VSAGHGGDNQDPGLMGLRRRYPRWRIWRGQATGQYWAMPPLGHPTVHELIDASDIDELADRIAHAEQQHDL
jgi:hypothetical protein